MGAVNANDWCISISSDDILSYFVYVGCFYGLIDNSRYKGDEKLWPSKTSEANTTYERWYELIYDFIESKVEQMKKGKSPNEIQEKFQAPEFSGVKCPVLRQCCKENWSQFLGWWYMIAGGKNALNFVEKHLSDSININEIEKSIGRKLKPFQLYIDLVYTGISETIDIQIENINLIITSSPFSSLTNQWWVDKLNNIG